MINHRLLVQRASPRRQEGDTADSRQNGVRVNGAVRNFTSITFLNRLIVSFRLMSNLSGD